ncbi:hypothetical protein Dimus_038176 [Dionaea muscipula]
MEEDELQQQRQGHREGDGGAAGSGLRRRRWLGAAMAGCNAPGPPPRPHQHVWTRVQSLPQSDMATGYLHPYSDSTSQEVTHPGTTPVPARLTAEF